MQGAFELSRAWARMGDAPDREIPGTALVTLLVTVLMLTPVPRCRDGGRWNSGGEING